MTTFTQDDTYNIHQCLQGNANAFEPLVRRYQNAAFAVALGYLRDRTDAEDVVQEAFVAAYCKLSQLKDPAIFGNWLHRIVVNRCKEWSRRKKVSRLVRVDPDAEHIRDEFTVADWIHREYLEGLELWDEVERLPEHYRKIVTLYYYTGFTLKEIAAFLDIPESTAKGRLYQSRIRLRDALSPQEQETIAMSQIDVTEDVQDVVCKIAREDFEETIEKGDMENIVLYCGVNTEVDFVPAPGNQVVVKGTKIALGLSDDKAHSNVSGLQISHDQVDNYLETGPHEGELFLGTSNPYGSDYVAATSPISKFWRSDLINDRVLKDNVGGVRTVDMFPDLQNEVDGFLPLPKPVGNSLGKAIRITVHVSNVRSIELPRTAVSGNVEAVFRAVCTDEKSLFGHATYCHMSISVPAGMKMSVFRSSKVNAEGLKGSLVTYSCYSCHIQEITGDVYLFNSEFSTIRRVSGLLYQRMYGCGGSSLDHDMLSRPDQWEGKIESIGGGVDIDVGRTAVDARDLNGDVSIFNRYGTTRLCYTDGIQKGRCNLRTVSGNLILALNEKAAKTTSLVMHTRCGVLKYEQVKELMPLNAWSSNDIRMSLGTTYEYGNTDVVLATESGQASIEVLKYPEHG